MGTPPLSPKYSNGGRDSPPLADASEELQSYWRLPLPFLLLEGPLLRPLEERPFLESLLFSLRLDSCRPEGWLDLAPP